MTHERRYRRSILAATALGGVLASTIAAHAQAGIAAAGENGSTVQQGVKTQKPAEQNGAPESVQVRARRLLLRERNSPSAVTELGRNAIQQVGVQGSVSTLLRQAPSVYVYQQGIGNNEPVISIRGLRGVETAETLDDVPMQDLLGGGGGQYLQNLLGGKFDLSQISGVSIYPGVAYPNNNTFGTIGGTVAYTSLRPSADREIDVLGSVGSFGTFQEGITLNSGRLDGFLGHGYDAPSMLAQYSNLQTKGYVDYTPVRYNNFEFALDKPYDQGLSKLQATVLYNTGDGLYTDEPIPTPYLQQNGMFSNYAPNLAFDRQNDRYATVILKDNTYINDYLNVGVSTFYENTMSSDETYGNPLIFEAPGDPGIATVGGAPPFNQTIAGFGVTNDYGPGGTFYDPPAGYSYNGNAVFPTGSTYCPASVGNAFTASGNNPPCGYNAHLLLTENDTYGVQPRLTLTLPSVYGVANTIKVGALIAKETSTLMPSYAWGTSSVPQTPANVAPLFVGQNDESDGGVQRTIYQVFAQDKIDMVRNTLHVTPGLTFEYSNSSFTSSSVFGGTPPASQLATPFCQNPANTCGYGAYSATKDDRELLPFVNIDYDLDKVLPVLAGTSLYASYGESALFAPVTDFTPNTEGLGPPSASIVHMYEAGAKYNTSHLVLSVDFYYQKVDRDFGFFDYEFGPLAGLSAYNNLGQRQFQGQEASAIWQVNQRWQVFGNFSHQRAVYLKTDLGNVSIQEDEYGIEQRGTPITGIPSFLATAGIDYDHRSWFVHGDEFHARFEGQYTGHQSTTYDLSGFENLGPLPYQAPYGTYQYYSLVTGATTFDPNGGIEPYVVFNLDLNYSLPVRTLGVSYLKKVDFDLNVLNLFNKHYFAYYYNQVSPRPATTFTSGPYAGQSTGLYTGPTFNDGLPGEPFAMTFTITAKF